MTRAADPKSVDRLRELSAIASFFSIATGLFALLGWAFGIPLLKSWVPGGYSTRFNAAVCLALVGLAALMLQQDKSRIFARRVGHSAAAIVTGIGLLSILENLLGWDLHIDQLLHVVRPGEEMGGPHPGLIPLVPAVSFALLGGAVLARDLKTRHRDGLSQILAAGAGTVSLMGVLDFALGQAGSHTYTALPGAVSLAVVSLGVICAQPENAFGGLLVSQGAGAKWLRWTLPATLACLILCFGLMSKALLTTVHLTWIEVSAIIITSIVLLIALIGRAAALLDRSEAQRERAEEALHLNAEQLSGLMGRFEDSPLEKSARRWAVVGIAIGILLTLLSGLTTWSTINRANRDDAWVVHTHTVETALEATLADITEIETGARGFAATGNASFLDSFLSGQSKVHNDLDRLASWTADNAVQREYVRELKPEVDARIEASEITIAERKRRGRVPSPAIFEEGQRRMDAVRATLGAMQAEEARLLEQRTKTSERTRGDTQMTTLIGTLLGVLLLTFAGLVTSREINGSAKMRSQIQRTNASLEQRAREHNRAEAALAESEKRYRSLVSASSEALYRMSPDWTEMRQLGGGGFIPDQDRPSKEWLEDYVPAEDQAKILNTIRVAIETKGVFELEHRVRRVDGGVGWTFSRAVPMLDAEGEISEWFGAASDITAQKRAEEALRESEYAFRSMAEATPQMVWTAGPDGQAIYHNKRWYDFAGYAEESESDWLSIVHPDEKDRARSLWSEALHSRRVFELQCRFWDQRNETYRWHLVRAVPFDGDAQTGPHWLGTCTDIDDFKRLSEELEARVNERTEALRQSLMEKTMLLKEIHHRVKNNLQVVCSLLSMQMRNARDKSVKAPLIAAHSRALAMSLVHEQVYRSESVADLNFGEYIEMLAGQLFGAYCVDPKRIRLELNIEPISLTIEDAVPCGLILNELLSNALKHAFTDGRQGVVRVAVRRIEGDSVECSVGDDGVGLGADFEWGRGQSLGMQIVGSLVRQLRAELVASHEGGAMFRFRWKCGAGTAQGTAAWPDERQPRADPSPALGRGSAKLLSMTREGRQGTAEAN